MDLEEILDTIISYDPTKPWEAVIHQFIFYCFRNCCLKRVIDSFDISENITETLPLDWDSLYELCEKYCDKNFKIYLEDFFDPEHYNQIEDPELLEIFFKNFINSLDIVITNNIRENDFIKFLDETLFNYFSDLFNNSELYIFPLSVDHTLNEEVYKKFRMKEMEFVQEPYYDVVYEPIELNKEHYKKRSMAHMMQVKRNGFLKTLRYSRASLYKTRKADNFTKTTAAL